MERPKPTPEHKVTPPSIEGISSMPLAEAAAYYAQAGWPVFPLQGKVPFKILSGREGHGYKDATTDQEQIRACWQSYPIANIGLATGEVSGVIVVDIDPRHNGQSSIKELERRYSVLPATRTSRTAHGGLHRFYQHPQDGNKYPNAVKLDGLSGIDIRGDGGYVVLPPSRLYTNRSYQWGLREHSIAPAPAWLLALLRCSKQDVTPQGGRFAESSGRKWLSQAVQEAREGNRNLVGFHLACQLRHDGVSEAEAVEIMRAYADQIPQGKHPYTIQEALASVRSAYSRPPRQRAQRRIF